VLPLNPLIADTSHVLIKTQVRFHPYLQLKMMSRDKIESNVDADESKDRERETEEAIKSGLMIKRHIISIRAGTRLPYNRSLSCFCSLSLLFILLFGMIFDG
jgi:hypothetical protein